MSYADDDDDELDESLFTKVDLTSNTPDKKKRASSLPSSSFSKGKDETNEKITASSPKSNSSSYSRIKDQTVPGTEIRDRRSKSDSKRPDPSSFDRLEPLTGFDEKISPSKDRHRISKDDKSFSKAPFPISKDASLRSNISSFGYTSDRKSSFMTETNTSGIGIMESPSLTSAIDKTSNRTSVISSDPTSKPSMVKAPILLITAVNYLYTLSFPSQKPMVPLVVAKSRQKN